MNALCCAALVEPMSWQETSEDDVNKSSDIPVQSTSSGIRYYITDRYSMSWSPQREPFDRPHSCQDHSSSTPFGRRSHGGRYGVGHLPPISRLGRDMVQDLSGDRSEVGKLPES